LSSVKQNVTLSRVCVLTIGVM